MTIVLKRLSYHLLAVFFILAFSELKGQINFNFSPVIYGQTIDGLAYVQIINTSGMDLRGFVTVKVREISGQDVVSIRTTNFLLRQGVNNISREAFSNARFSFGRNSFGSILNETGRFAEGEYEYCFEADITESKQAQLPQLFETCFESKIQPLTPLLLIDPADGDESCNKRPNFLWQPPMPLPATARFRLMVTEINEKQDIAEALIYNIPVINQANLFGNNLFYPPSAPELKEGHSYAWQVTVYTGKTILSKSEIWVLKIKCDEKKQDINTDSYRELKETDDGNFYIASRVLRFSFNNAYSSGELNYSIENLSDPQSAIKNLPKLKIFSGLNKYDLDLSENRSFKNGQEYLLRVKLINNRELRLRFIYKDE
jgi:hypothetical protein